MPSKEVTLSLADVSAKDPKPYLHFKNQFIQDNCQDCELAKARTQIVFDRGNPAAGILIVGEAPGAEEDKTGFCFVGRAGKMLDKMMQEAGFDVSRDMLVANVLKCRPPDNRPPTRQEAAACRPHLEKQIALFDPKVMVLLGATAAKHFFPGIKDFSRHVGQFENYSPKNIPCFFLYHPAYLLYDPRKKAVMAEKILVLKDFLIRKGFYE